MKTILDQIVEKKKEEVSIKKTNKTTNELIDNEYYNQKSKSSKNSILDPNKNGIIAEFKRKSPSKGFINEFADVKNVVSDYEKFGASVVSVLTDEHFFGGNFDIFSIARNNLTIPILRKDFIVDAYQVHETKAIGADLLLLIAECLDKNEILDLASLAKEIGLEILLEVHSEDQLEKLNDCIDLIGVNNRNLKTFEVDLEKSKQILKQLPENKTKIAESGIYDTETIFDLKNAGFDGFLIGENFMKESNPGKAFEEFTQNLKK